MKKQGEGFFAKGMMLVTASIIAGFLFGLVLGDMLYYDGLTGDEYIWFVLCMVATVIISYMLATVIHESGHFVFGLITGYRLTSFRIFCFEFSSKDGKVGLRIHNVPGTAGQCLMTQGNSDRYTLYNMGGVIFNVIFGVGGIVGYYLAPGVFSSILGVFSMVNFFLAVTNGIPHLSPMISNDGMNQRYLRTNDETRKSLRNQLIIVRDNIGGMRLKDMDGELFSYDSEKMTDGLACTLPYFHVLRNIDLGLYDEAISEIEQTKSYPYEGIHKFLLEGELVTLKLLKGEDVSSLLTLDLERMLKAMKHSVTAIRIRYAIAKLYDHNVELSNELKMSFERTVKKYSYPAEEQVERELIELIERKSAEQTAE